ncbi:MAG: recombination regulator RecX [Chloroflexota bacterium]|nr:recombination regulator RecX [Chloroflexota bacterium]
MEAAATFLAVRPRSVEETRRRLIHHGYRADLVEIVLGKLGEMGYLDDEAFARAWVESRDRSRPRGENALRRELSVKGIEPKTIAAVLAERAEGSLGEQVDPDALQLETRAHAAGDVRASIDVSAAERLLYRRRAALDREPDPRDRRQKAYALLARNGFDPQICQDVAGRFTTGDQRQDAPDILRMDGAVDERHMASGEETG